MQQQWTAAAGQTKGASQAAAKQQVVAMSSCCRSSWMHKRLNSFWCKMWNAESKQPGSLANDTKFERRKASWKMKKFRSGNPDKHLSVGVQFTPHSFVYLTFANGCLRQVHTVHQCSARSPSVANSKRQLQQNINATEFSDMTETFYAEERLKVNFKFVYITFD